MKMTIKQYYEVLKEKRKNAQYELNSLWEKYENKEISSSYFAYRKDKVTATINAYNDSICTLEASHLLDVDPKEETQNKAAAFDILNKSLDLELNGELKGFTKDEFPIFEPIVVARSNAGDGDDYCRGRIITMEEREILKKVGVKE